KPFGVSAKSCATTLPTHGPPERSPKNTSTPRRCSAPCWKKSLEPWCVWGMGYGLLKIMRTKIPLLVRRGASEAMRGGQVAGASQNAFRIAPALLTSQTTRGADSPPHEEGNNGLL